MYPPGCIILLLNAEMRPYLLPMVLSVFIKTPHFKSNRSSSGNVPLFFVYTPCLKKAANLGKKHFGGVVPKATVSVRTNFVSRVER